MRYGRKFKNIFLNAFRFQLVSGAPCSEVDVVVDLTVEAGYWPGKAGYKEEWPGGETLYLVFYAEQKAAVSEDQRWLLIAKSGFKLRSNSVGPLRADVKPFNAMPVAMLAKLGTAFNGQALRTERRFELERPLWPGHYRIAIDLVWKPAKFRLASPDDDDVVQPPFQIHDRAQVQDHQPDPKRPSLMVPIDLPDPTIPGRTYHPFLAGETNFATVPIRLRQDNRGIRHVVRLASGEHRGSGNRLIAPGRLEPPGGAEYRLRTTIDDLPLSFPLVTFSDWSGLNIDGWRPPKPGDPPYKQSGRLADRPLNMFARQSSLRQGVTSVVADARSAELEGCLLAPIFTQSLVKSNRQQHDASADSLKLARDGREAALQTLAAGDETNALIAIRGAVKGAMRLALSRDPNNLEAYAASARLLAEGAELPASLADRERREQDMILALDMVVNLACRLIKLEQILAGKGGKVYETAAKSVIALFFGDEMLEDLRRAVNAFGLGAVLPTSFPEIEKFAKQLA